MLAVRRELQFKGCLYILSESARGLKCQEIKAKRGWFEES